MTSQDADDMVTEGVVVRERFDVDNPEDEERNERRRKRNLFVCSMIFVMLMGFVVIGVVTYIVIRDFKRKTQHYNNGTSAGYNSTNGTD